MAASSIGHQIHINVNSPILLPLRTNFSSLSFTFSNAKYPLKWNHIGCPKICALPAVSIIASGSSREMLPPALDSSSEPPAIFDGTPKLYISYSCPYAQRTWIARNCKALQEEIKLVPIDLKNRPDWYKEKVYPANKVPSLEHNNEVKGESMDLIRYIDSNFEGQSLFPDDPSKREFAEELFSYFDSFYKAVISSLKEDKINDATFDSIETALSKFVDGSFFLGSLSLSLIRPLTFLKSLSNITLISEKVDIAYAPFIERFQPFLLEVKNYDITTGRTKLAAWIKEMNQIEGYTVTKRDPKEHLENYKRRFLSQL